MDATTVNLAVQAHWLRYKGLAIESARSWHRIDNAGHKPAFPHPLEDMPVTGGYMVAT